MGRSKRDRLAFGVVGCMGLLLTAFVGSAAALQPGCSQSGTTVTCTYYVGNNAFTVPGGVGEVHVVAVGGAGGSWQACRGNGGGGFGARVTGDLAVTPGSTLYAVVGGDGCFGEGGANGGANGTYFCGLANAGGGGGASDVRTINTDLTSRLLVAAGGGGDGCGVREGSFGLGGNAGFPGSAGGPGESVVAGRVLPNGATGGLGGMPGTQSAGGIGGAGGIASPVCTGSGCPGEPGVAGSIGAGGRGGVSGLPPQCSPDSCLVGGGGGGGGGLFGGGGGGGGGNGDGATTSGDGVGGGGGGGSSLVPAGGSCSIDTTALPEVVLSYTQ